MELVIKRSSKHSELVGELTVLTAALSELYHKLGIESRLKGRVDGNQVGGTGEYSLVLVYDEVLSSGSMVITFFGTYYSLESQWFYLTDPATTEGVPLFSLSDLMQRFGLPVRADINDLIIRYKLTGKLNELLSELQDSSVQVSYFRLLLLPVMHSVDGDYLLDTFYRMQHLVISTLTFLSTFCSLKGSTVAWDNARLTINRNFGLVLKFRQALLDIDTGHGEKLLDPKNLQVRDLFYMACNPQLLNTEKAEFTKLKALNSAEVLRMEARASLDVLYFTPNSYGTGGEDGYGISPSVSRYIQLVDGKERNAVSKVLVKHQYDVGASVPGDNVFTSTGYNKRLRYTILMAGKIAGRIAGVGVI